ncbi:hypothetical protein AGRA3207_003744 [Actinomadura graeca]|uniref:Uncharacterized protein n=1 Tax=Actinomadura graeca TaxID=2750812 RepID=A0ABX8QVC7_9ACTN|nr:hypothetical protein [Actinomadura graeca]QXJ22696.1 hypothetical protein AGRA3207_003744 [Actinomadura graeca]
MTTPADVKPAASGRGVSFGLAATILAIPTGIAFINPDLAVVLASAELALMLTVLVTAVFAPRTVSERAFRLLRWMTGHPEPARPAEAQAEEPAAPGPARAEWR